MSKTYILSILFCASVVLSSQKSFGQKINDTVNNKSVFLNAEDNFYTEIGPQSRLFNGIDYEYYDPSFKGNAYFLDSASWSNGSIIYDGYLYKNVPLLYDIYTDQVITQAYHSALKIQLLKNRVSSFDLLGHHIVYIERDPANPTSPRTGFYDELYKGYVAVFAARSKSTQKNWSFNNAIITYFVTSTDYYLYKNGHYYAIGSKGSMLSVLKDKKSELQKYIRANNLKFNKQQKEQSMAQIAAYYDHITN